MIFLNSFGFDEVSTTTSSEELRWNYFICFLLFSPKHLYSLHSLEKTPEEEEGEEETVEGAVSAPNEKEGQEEAGAGGEQVEEEKSVVKERGGGGGDASSAFDSNTFYV